MLGDGILAKHPLRAVERRVEGGIFARAPLLALQRGVRTALTITTSLGCLGEGYCVDDIVYYENE